MEISERVSKVRNKKLMLDKDVKFKGSATNRISSNRADKWWRSLKIRACKIPIDLRTLLKIGGISF